MIKNEIEGIPPSFPAGVSTTMDDLIIRNYDTYLIIYLHEVVVFNV